MKKLIITIVSRGYADDLMSAARVVGASGGTIINARGTGTEEDTTFFGIHLASEKEMLLIVADSQDAAKIIDVIKTQPVFSEPGAGIVFTLNIEESFLL
jgi:nitrogen regulatory protein PII